MPVLRLPEQLLDLLASTLRELVADGRLTDAKPLVCDLAPAVDSDVGLDVPVEDRLDEPLAEEALAGTERSRFEAEPALRPVYLNMIFEPLTAKRHVRVTATHTMQDFAACMRLVDELYPHAEIVRVVLDNLSTHKPAALYETFPPDEARRILKKLEFHFTPKHGSWLNMAEIELSVYGRTMKTHLPDRETFDGEAQALTKERNDAQVTVCWQCRTPDARIKLKQLYPSLSL